MPNPKVRAQSEEKKILPDMPPPPLLLDVADAAADVDEEELADAA